MTDLLPVCRVLGDTPCERSSCARYGVCKLDVLAGRPHNGHPGKPPDHFVGANEMVAPSPAQEDIVDLVLRVSGEMPSIDWGAWIAAQRNR